MKRRERRYIRCRSSICPYVQGVDLLQEIAVMLFQKEKITLAQASRLAQMTRFQFQHLLASRDIPIHYDVKEFEEDLQTLRKLGRL